MRSLCSRCFPTPWSTKIPGKEVNKGSVGVVSRKSGRRSVGLLLVDAAPLQPLRGAAPAAPGPCAGPSPPAPRPFPRRLLPLALPRPPHGAARSGAAAAVGPSPRSARLRARDTAGPLPAENGPSAPAAPASPRSPRTPGRLGRGGETSPLPGEVRAARCPPLSPATPAPSAPSPAVPGVGLAGPGSPRLRPSWQRPWRRPPGTAPQRRLAVPRSRRPPLPVRAVSESMAALPAGGRHGRAGTRAPPARAATWANFGAAPPPFKGAAPRPRGAGGAGAAGGRSVSHRGGRRALCHRHGRTPLPSGLGQAHSHLFIFTGSPVVRVVGCVSWKRGALQPCAAVLSMNFQLSCLNIPKRENQGNPSLLNLFTVADTKIFFSP